jgi:hypothetical protein
VLLEVIADGTLCEVKVRGEEERRREGEKRRRWRRGERRGDAHKRT